MNATKLYKSGDTYPTEFRLTNSGYHILLHKLIGQDTSFKSITTQTPKLFSIGLVDIVIVVSRKTYKTSRTTRLCKK